MLKKFVIIAALALITACTQTAAPEMSYFNGQKIKIDASVDAGMFTGVLKLKINDELVIEERSQAFGGSSQTFTGTWNKKQVRARVTLVQNLFSSYHMVDVFIDGDLVDTLSL